jgi:hypothetical protein
MTILQTKDITTKRNAQFAFQESEVITCGKTLHTESQSQSATTDTVSNVEL